MINYDNLEKALKSFKGNLSFDQLLQDRRALFGPRENQRNDSRVSEIIKLRSEVNSSSNVFKPSRFLSGALFNFKALIMNYKISALKTPSHLSLAYISTSIIFLCPLQK